MWGCNGVDWGCSPDQAEQGHVPRVPSRHKRGEGVRHVYQDVHVADMVGHNHRCNMAHQLGGASRLNDTV